MASRCWDRICEYMDGMKILTTVDSEILELYCRAYGKWREAEEKIRKAGLVIETATTTRVNPYVTVSNALVKQMTSLLSEIGLTPSSRSRLHATPQDSSEPVAKLMKRRAG